MRHTLKDLAIAACLAATLVAPASALAGSKYANLRVVTNSGRTLADQRQYAGEMEVRASKKADCFGEEHPSSSKHHTLDKANPLGVLAEAAGHRRSMKPLLLTDAFVDDGFGFGVCRIGDFAIEGFSYWYLAVNGVGASTGPDLIPMHNGDEQLWYLTTGSEPGFPNELVLRAPPRARPGVPFSVRVTRVSGDGSSAPAEGVQVGSAGPTDADGTAQVTLGDTASLRATGAADDIPSARLRVCVAADLSDCPARRDLRISGSAGGDRIQGSARPDRITARAGDDRIAVRGGGADNVNCGAGDDVVVLGTGDHAASNCERRVR